LFGLKWAPQTQGRKKPLRIVGCRGIRKLLEAIDEANNYNLFAQPYPVELHEVSSPAEFELMPGLRAQTFSTPHTRESLALRLTNKDGISLVYTADTGYSEELATFASGAGLLLMECSFFRNKPALKHLELDEAMRLAHIAKPDCLVLTHLYAEWDGVDLESKARELWSGKTLAAYDGLRLEIAR
jgi:ribonuclease BN (tRNA processing enzyme)